MTQTPQDFIRAQTSVTTASLVPEIKLHLATECTPLWQMTEERLNQNNLPPPFWAFAWPGGQGMARYLIENPDIVRGKRVLDFAAGCGIASIAAMQSGASGTVAIEIDPLALAVIPMNAAHNNVQVDVANGIDMDKVPKNIDVILGGDVCYQADMSAILMRWLWLCFAKGIKVLLSDPGRAYVPRDGLELRAQYVVPTSRDLEDNDTRTAKIWELVTLERED